MDFVEELKKILGDEPDKIDSIKSLTGKCFVAKKDYNELSTKTNGYLADLEQLKKEQEELETSKLTEQEKLSKELEKATANKKKYTIELNKLEAERILVKAGLSEDEYASFIDGFVKEDMEATKTLANNFITMLAKKTSDLRRELEEKNLVNLPDPATADNETTKITKADFDKMTYSQEVEFATSHPELYKEYSKTI